MATYDIKLKIIRSAGEGHSTYEHKAEGHIPALLLIPMGKLTDECLTAARNWGREFSLDIKIDLPEK